ncbi:GH1 family beta-glucosidase [Ferruginibacter albus]|uniref:GH1 family beta-glucosidase n=1 Tax=Ferruginibacter albus TaxID=2875540 RepID=UPI001CC4E005|nr:GH1 family beta-glucosidase [Ferruginibacter albus]UAY52961.1 beta-glucosidase [Ferruginibacter albus]
MSSSLHHLKATDFGKNFQWGVAIAAAQNEGAANQYGRGPSIWDVFSRNGNNIKGKGKPTIACDFYHRYKDDLLLVKALGFNSFRLSISWSRILPDGTGKINKEGIDFYHRVIDECIKLELTPYVTLYHWDLPYELEKKGGWTNYFINKWFNRFITVCAEAYGSKVKNWIILNEPFAYTSLGYMLGTHAPGKKGIDNFFPSVHHTTIAQAEGARIIRQLVPYAYIGTTFSFSEIIPHSDKKEDIQAANRVDILMNRLFIEPALGKGYPREETFRLTERMHLHNKEWKYIERLHFDFDFIGIQYYFPLVIKYNSLIPLVQASEVKAKTRKVPHTDMGWEINADSFYRTIKRIWSYDAVKEIIITENGSYFKDEIRNGVIDDAARINYFQQHLQAVLAAKNEGVNIKGYFAWTLMDNFEWAEGYNARFGLVHVDFNTQLRTIKNSGYWFRDFLSA